MKRYLLTIFMMFAATFLQGEQAALFTQKGEEVYFEVGKENTIEEIVENTKDFAPKHLIIKLEDEKETIDYSLKKHGGPIGAPRNYYRELSSNEKNDVTYIVKTLANHSLITIAFHRSSLEAAGDRIDHLHPLRFLLTVFADEELKVCMRNIRTRGWIWNDFLAGLKESLITESSLENIKMEYVNDFSSKVALDVNYILGSIQNKNWDEFIETLIHKVPRTGDPGRYDS